MMTRATTLLLTSLLLAPIGSSVDEPARKFSLKLRTSKMAAAEPDRQPYPEQLEQPQTWNAAETAVIVCDVWDRHHCLNAVRRMEEFLPRLQQVLDEARRRGAIIIHSPSDCMPAYENHPARQRATAVPAAANQPPEIRFWCSQIPAEEQAMWPIDQSDGGEDDDPTEHARWAAQLTAEGRNAALPWKSQHPGIQIDAAKDYISDRGDEVWNILESRRIRNVILTGVHTNMCVLGRPFGLRQMARAGKQVVLVRDLTDCMYNPKRWPYVDHFTGNDYVISHVEQFVCPTITSDQIVGGAAHRSRYDQRPRENSVSPVRPPHRGGDFEKHWTTAAVPATWNVVSAGARQQVSGTLWLRCSVRLPAAWIEGKPVELQLPDGVAADCWLNGQPMTDTTPGRKLLPAPALLPDGINLLVLKTVSTASEKTLPGAPSLTCGARTLSLGGRWQLRIGDDPTWSNLPLPAQFGLGPDVLFSAPLSTGGGVR